MHKRKHLQPDVLQTSQKSKKTLLKAKKEPCQEASKSKVTSDPLSHLPTLESHNGIPQNQRHPSSHANIRTQKHHEHAEIHSARRFPRRRIHLKSNQRHRRSTPTDRKWIRIRMHNTQRNHALPQTQMNTKRFLSVGREN